MERYIVRGLIDGSLSTIGIVIGASTAIGTGAEAAHIIIAAGLGGGIANGLSNVLGAFTAEKAAVHKRFERVEKAMLKENVLRDTEIHGKSKEKILSSGTMDGIATIAGSIIPVAPFFLLSPFSALQISIGISLLLFFFLGVYVGKISRENVILSGLKLVGFAAGTACIATFIRMVA